MKVMHRLPNSWHHLHDDDRAEANLMNGEAFTLALYSADHYMQGLPLLSRELDLRLWSCGCCLLKENTVWSGFLVIKRKKLSLPLFIRINKQTFCCMAFEIYTNINFEIYTNINALRIK